MSGSATDLSAHLSPGAFHRSLLWSSGTSRIMKVSVELLVDFHQADPCGSVFSLPTCPGGCEKPFESYLSLIMQMLPGAEQMGVRVWALPPIGNTPFASLPTPILMVSGLALPPPRLKCLEVSGYQPQGGKDFNIISCHMLQPG